VSNIVPVRKYQICHGIDIGFFHFVISLFVYSIGGTPAMAAASQPTRPAVPSM